MNLGILQIGWVWLVSLTRPSGDLGRNLLNVASMSQDGQDVAVLGGHLEALLCGQLVVRNYL